MWHRLRLCTIALAITIAAAAQAQDPGKRIDELERQVAALREQVQALHGAGDADLQELQRRIEILAAEIEKLKAGESTATADRAQQGLGPAASKVYREKQGISLGGYGEVLYQNFDGATDAGAPSGKTDELDLLRAVLYAGYKFNDRWVLNTEVEYEHASTEGSGEVSVEFAYLDFLWKPQASVRMGLLLLPIGLVNELHEPTSFLGARRPEVERALIPTTWSEIGAGLYGEAGPVAYRTFVTTALDASEFTAEGIREGRQGGSEAKAENFAWSGRLDYKGLPGLIAGVSAHVGDTGQDLTTGSGASIGARTALIEAHADWRWRGFQARALTVRSTIDDVAELNAALGLVGNASIGDEQHGTYAEIGYDVLNRLRQNPQSLVPFVRWEALDTQAEVPAGFARDPQNDRKAVTFGVNYRPIEFIVLKADFQNLRNAAGTATDQFNVALGWIF